jgi:hypothetical protein
MSSGIAYRPREDATPEGELSSLAAVYKFVLFDSQARKGNPYDLTNSSNAETPENGLQRTEREKT